MRVGLLLWASVLLPLRAQEGSFGTGLYQVMEKAKCRSCHTPDGVASATRLHLPDPTPPRKRLKPSEDRS